MKADPIYEFRVCETIVDFLLTSRGRYETPDEAAYELLLKLTHEGYMITRVRPNKGKEPQ